MSRAEYERRRRELSRWGNARLRHRCAALGHYGFSGGLHGLAGWSSEELQTEILRSEFPAEASNG